MPILLQIVHWCPDPSLPSLCQNSVRVSPASLFNITSPVWNTKCSLYNQELFVEHVHKCVLCQGQLPAVSQMRLEENINDSCLIAHSKYVKSHQVPSASGDFIFSSLTRAACPPLFSPEIVPTLRRREMGRYRSIWLSWGLLLLTGTRNSKGLAMSGTVWHNEELLAATQPLPAINSIPLRSTMQHRLSRGRGLAC